MELRPIQRVIRNMPTEKDWQEDWPHENGKYTCTCVACGGIFTGHKRRVICRACFLLRDAAPKGNRS